MVVATKICSDNSFFWSSDKYLQNGKLRIYVVVKDIKSYYGTAIQIYDKVTSNYGELTYIQFVDFSIIRGQT